MTLAAAQEEVLLETVPSRPKKRRNDSSALNATSRKEVAVRYVLLVLVLLIMIGPFLWELSTSLKGPTENIFTKTPSLIPAHPSFHAYSTLQKTIPVWHYMRNSLVVVALVVVGNCVGATIAGFALARLDFRFRKVAIGLFIGSLLLPGEVTIISQFIVVNKLGFANSLIGVALPGAISALNVLLMTNAFRGIPADVDNAAVIDGCNVWQRFIHIGLPSVKGSISVVAIFAFIGAWDDFLWPLIVLQDPNKYTLTVGLSYLQGQFSKDPRVIAAGTMFALIPIIIFFSLLQKHFFKGVGEGAVKG